MKNSSGATWYDADLEAIMDFLDQIAAYKTVPAGGAASAYAATLGIGLLYKVLLFELNRAELSSEKQESLRTAKTEIERLFLNLKKIVHQDPVCYEKFSGALRSETKTAGKRAFLDVMTCSMNVIDYSVQGLDWIAQLRKVSSIRLAAHLKVSAELLAAAIAGTAHVARENLKPIKSKEKRQSYLANLDGLYERAMTRKKEVMETI